MSVQVYILLYLYISMLLYAVPLGSDDDEQDENQVPPSKPAGMSSFFPEYMYKYPISEKKRKVVKDKPSHKMVSPRPKTLVLQMYMYMLWSFVSLITAGKTSQKGGIPSQKTTGSGKSITDY